jgi:SAM-dependent methyltransferase
MLRVLAQRVPRPQCEPIQADFEDCDLPPRAFEAVFACHSWHWLEKTSRISRCAALLSPGGRLCVVYNVHVRDDDARFGPLRRAVYAEWAPEIEHLDPSPVKLQAARAELTASSVTGPVTEVAVEWSRRFTSAEFAAMLASYSNHIVLPPDRREALLTGIRRVIDQNLGGTVSQTFRSAALITSVSAHPPGLVLSRPQ